MAPPVAFDDLMRGDKAALAAALAQIESNPHDAATIELLTRAFERPRAHVIGVTGPPGVGKSTLLGKLIESLRARGRTVGGIAVDPSSRRSGGGLLGDRLPPAAHPREQG